MTELASIAAILAYSAAAHASDAVSTDTGLPVSYEALAAASGTLLLIALSMGIAFVRVRRHERAARDAVAERDRALQAIRLGEERYLDLFNNINGGVAVLDVRGNGAEVVLEDLNAAGERIEGRFREDMIGRGIHESGIGGMGEPLIAACREVWRTGKPLRRDLAGRQKDELERWFECFVYKLSSGEVVVVYEDVTPRRRAEEQNRLLATAVECAAESVFITSRNGCIEYVNPAFETLSGYSREEVIGETPRILKSGRHGMAFYREMWETILGGHTWRGRLTNKRKDGTLYEKEITISPVLSGAGDIEHFVAISRDLSQEIQLAAQLRQAQKMEAIGTLAGGIAHDFNNILGAIIGFAELAIEDMPEPTVTRNCVDEVRKAGRRAAELVHQILTFSRQTEQERRPVLVQSVLKEALKLLRGSLPSTIIIEQDIDPECGQIMADPTQIHQVMVNLCTNAYHAMREQGGVLTVRYSESELPGGAPRQTSPLPPGRFACLSVVDTGRGMSKTTLERIFEPYFTTKPPGEGTGMGLSIVHGIVRAHEGAITVDSVPGEGTAFNVFIPLFLQEDATETPLEDEAAPRGRGERVLFVDDEESLALLARISLERLGFRVASYTRSTEALRQFEADPAQFDVVITDQTMPDMTGEALAAAIRAIRSDIPIILCTGFSERLDKRRASEAGFSGYLEKPFVDVDLCAAIRRVLSGALIEETP